MLRKCSLLVLLFAATLPAAAQSISGPAKVTDGDTLKISGEAVRLHGIDAPEAGQSCLLEDGATWPCGRWSQEVLADLVGHQTVTCSGTGRDRYGRLVATCHVGGVDLGQEMVARGAAFAYRKYALDYVDAEKRALLEARGIWRGDATRPEDFRRATAAVGPDPAAGE